ncbi:MAG: class I SAM-dependent methyltransferase [Bryobacteraceae bacterium]|nr:class I SAM-dependent methyltransferase [Bryobacteraceae bacterium]
MTHSHFDFGYPWWLSYGHLALLAASAAVLALGRKLGWKRWPMILLGLFAAWCMASFLVVQLVIGFNDVGSLPTENFLRAGTGRVLDLGAGTGRSAIAVLEARPQATLVALDLFGESFDSHFGKGDSPRERLARNLRAAGMEQRVTIETADMRRLPFPAASFEAVVSAYAVDHLSRQGSAEAIGETARVLKPGGDFLLMVVGKEPWIQFTFGPLLLHSANRGPGWWKERLREAGFAVVEDGYRPVTYFVLARKAVN